MNLIRVIPAKGSGQDNDYPDVFRFSGHQAACPSHSGQAAFFIAGAGMDIIVNGVTETISPCTIAELVGCKGLATGALVVELNQQIIKQEQWPVLQLKPGDRLELLSFVGGG